MKTIRMYCPFCDCEHDLQIVENNSECIIKGEKVQYVETSLLCVESDEIFDNGEILDQNLLKAKDEYRKNHNLLTSKEIEAIRNKYNISQADLSLILGWGEVTITRYETKEIQNENYDKILRQIDADPNKLQDYFMLNKEKFSQSKQAKIAKKIFALGTDKESINKNIEETIIKKHYTISDIYKGKQEISLQKILSVIQYITNSGIKLYKTKLAKLLWYIDMINFKSNKKSITGLAYYHMPYGACPLGIDLILDSKNIDIEEIEEDDSTKFLIKNAHVESNLSKEEQESIDMVINLFKDFSTKDLVSYMHNEKAYLDTNANEFISYNFAKDIHLFSGGEQG